MLTLNERIEIILLCGREGWSMRKVAEEFNSNHINQVTHTSVSRLLTKFKKTGSVLDIKKVRKSKFTEEEKNRVIEKYNQNPKLSLRRASLEAGMSVTSIQKILKSNSFHTYKLQVLHKINEDDPDRRMEMCDFF